MATKRIIQLPTLNNGQVTGGNSSQAGYLRKLPNELPGGDGPNPKLVIQTPQTDANGNITGGGGKKTAMNSPEEPEVWTYRGNNGVVQTIDKGVQQGGQPATTYGSKTDRSATLLNTGKNGTTNGLPQATPANLPGVTKYAGQDKTAGGIKYGNNQAGIDLVNKQGSTELLTAGEAAQRTAGQYEKMPLPGQKIANVVKYQDNSDGTTTQYLDDGTSEIVRLVRNVDGTYSTQDVGQPAPTVATTQNPVIKKTLDKPQEQTVTPAVLQGADMNTLNSTLDELKYKVNVEGKQLTKDEYMTFESARRQLQDMMKPQALTGGLDGLIANKENEIKQVTDESKINNDQELADFTRSQEVYKQAELDNIQKSFEREQETMRLILAGQGAGQGTFAVDKLNELSQNNQQKISILNEAVQAKIDLYGSQLRKDSQATIEAMKTRLDNFYLKAADLDVKNIEMVNAYNKEQGASKIEQIDKMMALAQSQAMAMQPLTEQEQAQAQAFAGNLYDNEGNFQNNVFEMLYKVNPKLANAAVMQGTAIQKERLSNDLAMKGLDADIKRAQLNKLLNPDVDYKVVANDDGTYTRTGSDGSVTIVDPKSGASTSAVETIKKREGFRDKAYQDSTGTWTIGYGFTNVDGKPVQPGMTMDRGTADSLLGQEISQRQNFMNYINVPLSDSQKAALSSFEFNLGSGIRAKNAKPILDKINAGDLQGAGNLMKQYTTSKGQQLQGLVNRRNEEARLLLDKGKSVNQYSTGKDAIKELTGLRKEFNALPEVKNYKQVVTSYKTIEEQAKKATPAGDLSMIFAYMKLLDPTSTVREGEFANAQNAASIPDQIVNAYNKAKEGTRLNDKQRQDFLNGAKTQLQSYENQYNKALEEYNTYVTAGGDPSQIGTFGDVSGSNVTKGVDIALQAGGVNNIPQTTVSPQVENDFTKYFK